MIFKEQKMIRLEKMAITGYRGISNRIEFQAKDFNVIVGKNDAGKSTILRALDLFLNNKQFIAENLNNLTAQYAQIELFFLPNNTPIIIDENVQTSFEDEGLINEEGRLQIIKRWDGTKEGKISPEYFVIRKSYGEMDFFNKTEAGLIKHCRDNGLDAEPGLMTNATTGEEHNNTEKRQRLSEIYDEQNIEFEFIKEKLPTSGQTRLKKTEQAIKLCFPQFEYFVADTSLSENDSAIQKYFKDMALKVIQEGVDTDNLETTVRNQLQSILDKITSKINAVVPETEKVSARVDFDWSKIITTNFESDGTDGAVPLSSRGDGFRRITMMSYFEHLAEEKREDHKNIIFAFEEPETFLHPSSQENLFDKLRDISQAGYQVLMTTHSPVLVSRTNLADLHHILKDGPRYQCVSDVRNYKEIAEDLGVTVDNQFISLFDKARCLLLVEGINDCIAFNYLSEKYSEAGIIENGFEELGIIMIPIGGCGSMKHWLSLDLLNTLNKPYYIYLDSDKTREDMDSPHVIKLTEAGLVEGVNFSVSRKRELENYIPPTALQRLVPGCGITFTDWCDVKTIVKTHRLSSTLGGKNVAEKHFTSLTIAELQNAFNPTGADDEFVGIYEKLSSLLVRRSAAVA